MNVLRGLIASWLILACTVVYADRHSNLANQDLPNFLVIVADDMGWSDLGVLGGAHRQIRYLEEQFPIEGQRLWPNTAALMADAEYWFDEGMLNFGTAVALFSRQSLSYLLNQQPKSLVEEKFRRHPLPTRGMAFIVMRNGMQFPTDVLAGTANVLVSGLRSVSDLILKYGGPWLPGHFSMLDVTMQACFHRLQDLRLETLLGDTSILHVATYWDRLQAHSSYRDGVLSRHDEASWRRSIDDIFPDGTPPDLPLLEAAMQNKKES